MFCAYNRPKAQISGERLHDHWSSGFFELFPVLSLKKNLFSRIAQNV